MFPLEGHADAGGYYKSSMTGRESHNDHPTSLSSHTLCSTKSAVQTVSHIDHEVTKMMEPPVGERNRTEDLLRRHEGENV